MRTNLLACLSILLLFSCSNDDASLKYPVGVTIDGEFSIYAGEIFSPTVNEYGEFETAVVARNPRNRNELIEFHMPYVTSGNNIVTSLLYKQNDLFWGHGPDFQSAIEISTSERLKGTFEGNLASSNGIPKHMSVLFDLAIE